MNQIVNILQNITLFYFSLLLACSRSQCIINISSVAYKIGEVDNNAVLTIVDLAGAEREKRTGNQVLSL